ncbi:MAG: class I SAM-dependent methyltransferase [Acidobacteriota bacterium]|nr:class I SAM-dependent methyltransferase [Acidobacteriota bacterium]
MTLPAGFENVVNEAWRRARGVQGYMGEKEFRALAQLAALSARSQNGLLVEIGSFKGKSTIALAMVARSMNLGKVVSIDPHTAPSQTDPDLRGQLSSFDEFMANLRSAGIEDQVEVYRQTSQEAGKGWERPVRFLWVDGDHTYEGASSDISLFLPHLAPGGIVAIHDVLHEFEGPIRVFVERILDSDDFGPSGFYGSIGWAQYLPNSGGPFLNDRKKLRQRAAHLLPIVAGGRKIERTIRLKYKFRRWMILRASAPPGQWQEKIVRG